MKPILRLKWLGLVALALLTVDPQVSNCLAQGTSFTYQGRLDSGGTPFSGNAEFQPTLWNAVSGGVQVAINSPATTVVLVTNGLFVLPLDFGMSFPGADRWLQLEVRTTLGAFTRLSPRQRLTATPYALTAANLSGTLPDSQLGANVARTNQVWLLGGNNGTAPGTHFLGTGDGQPLELRAGGIGIGTRFPTAALTVIGDEGNGTNATVKVSSNAQVLMLDGNEIDSTAALHLNSNRPNNVSLASGGGNVGISTMNPLAKLHVNGTARLEGNTTIGGNAIIGGLFTLARSTVTARSDMTLVPATSYVFLNYPGPGAVWLNATTAIANGPAPGAILILQGRGVVVPNGANTVIGGSGGSPRTFGIGGADTLTLIWDGSDWVELSFANNQ